MLLNHEKDILSFTIYCIRISWKPNPSSGVLDALLILADTHHRAHCTWQSLHHARRLLRTYGTVPIMVGQPVLCWQRPTSLRSPNK